MKSRVMNLNAVSIAAFVAVIFFLGLTTRCLAQAKQSTTAGSTNKPNMLVIFGDDIGITNVSAYSNGLMGYETPNIDRIGKEGIRFLQYYGEQSCTAGRSAFLTGQHVIRSGLSKVGYPGAPMGMVLFLCSQFASFAVGQTFVIDGGYTTH